MGPDWIDHYVTRLGLDFNSYLGADLDTFNLRMITLAELLLNMQDVKGFSECLSLLVDGRLEAAFAELDVGRVLSYSNVRFGFNVRTGQLKSDYDLNVFFRNGERGCAETKCKIEGKTITAKSVLNTLQHARKQLPNDEPGVIFLRMPEAWMRNIKAEEDITPAVKGFMRGTRTVVAVEIFSTGSITLGHGSIVRRLQLYRV